MAAIISMNDSQYAADAQNNTGSIDQTTTNYGWTGWEDYEETTVDPGIWMFLITCVFCFVVMLVVVPILVIWKTRQQNFREQSDKKHASEKSSEDNENKEAETNFRNILSFDQETRSILKIAIPFTLSGLASASLANICLALVGHHIGTKPVAAYAIVHILVSLTGALTKGPISALTSVCSHAVGAGNDFLAGQYLQLSILLYLLLSIPVIAFWRTYMAEVVLFLEWGDQETAEMAKEFTIVYIWSHVVEGVSTGLWQLIEVADHAFEVTLISTAFGVTNVVAIATLVTTRKATLTEVGLCYIATAVFFLLVTCAVAECKGWWSPYKHGFLGSLSLKNGSAIEIMTRQAVPLAFGSLLSHAEWAILTFMASALGPAEVAVWALLGNIWEVLYSTTSGIGSAAELRVSLLFGSNRPNVAKISGYKSLFLSMSLASIISIFYFSFQARIPGWFTVDPTLQAMLRDLVPFVGVANLAMQFGETSWYLIGAQGHFKLATWVSFISSWGICMPLAATFVFCFRIDLQGLISAVVIGYVTTSATLSFVLLSTNWKEVSQKIQGRNAHSHRAKEILAEKDDDDSDDEVRELLQLVNL